MELKSLEQLRESGQTLFKLYLYGIEIRDQERYKQILEVQIVPLWNWN